MRPRWEAEDREYQLAEQARADAQEYRDAAAEADHHDHRRPTKAEADEMRHLDDLDDRREGRR